MVEFDVAIEQINTLPSRVFSWIMYNVYVAVVESVIYAAYIEIQTWCS